MIGVIDEGYFKKHSQYLRSLVLAFLFGISGISPHLFIVLLQCCKILARLREFTLQSKSESMIVKPSIIDNSYLLHALTDIPMHKGTFRVHEVEFIICSKNVRYYQSADAQTRRTKSPPSSRYSGGAV
jgi:hypothetical protein